MLIFVAVLSVENGKCRQEYTICSKEQKIQNTKNKENKQEKYFAVLPTFSTSYTLERSTSNMSIMPEVGPVAKTAQVEIVMQKAVARLSLRDSICTASIPRILPQRSL